MNGDRSDAPAGRPGGQLVGIAEQRAPDIRLRFDGADTAPGTAREAVSRWFDPTDVLAEDVTLAASELVTNVVVHTDEPGTMELWDDATRDRVRLEVHDTDQSPPRVREDPSHVGGFGLRIVATVTDSWGWVRTATGKTVWSEFQRGRTSP